MLSRKGAEIKGEKNVTIIAEGVKIDGKVNCPGSVRIDGMVKGDIVIENEVIIGKEGKVEAKMKTKDAVVAGSYKGNMIATGEVEITATGKFIGNLTQKDALLTIAKGGLFKGESLVGDTETFKPKEEKKVTSTDQRIKRG